METYVADSELATLLAVSESTGELLRVRANGATYLIRVEIEDGRDLVVVTHRPNPELMDEMLHKYAGSWSDLDADELKENLYRARDDGTRPINRP